MSQENISDEEVVLRRIPPGTQWFEPPDRITSANFKLRPDELGISVYQQSIVSAKELLDKEDAIPGSFVVFARVGDIRHLTNAEGKPLELDVIPDEDEDNPGHADIRSTTPGKLSRSASRALSRLFQKMSCN